MLLELELIHYIERCQKDTRNTECRHRFAFCGAERQVCCLECRKTCLQKDLSVSSCDAGDMGPSEPRASAPYAGALGGDVLHGGGSLVHLGSLGRKAWTSKIKQILQISADLF